MAKWFSKKEIKGLKLLLVALEDKAREYAGVPFVNTSGRRTKEENKNAGGVEASAHLTGDAVDIAYSDKYDGILKAWALGLAGFERIGIYDKHLHVDIDKTKPAPTHWIKRGSA